MKIVCLDADTLGYDVDLKIFEKFGSFYAYSNTKAEDTIKRLKDVDIVITNKVLITKQVIEQTNLKLICVSATGLNNIDLKAAKESGIPVKNVAGYSTNSVVQQTFATLLELTNNTNYYRTFVNNGEWVKNDIFTHLGPKINEIAGRKFGIIGLGTIGKKVAVIASAFGCEIYYYSTSGKNKNSEYISVGLDELLATCDIISIHAPLNEQTRNLISKDELNRLKPGAILMNFGRGGIVNEADLAKVIDKKEIKVALDVLETEPMVENHPFLSIRNKQNLLITPHIAWASIEARTLLIEKIA
ncbi:MAG: D-2-hydroxyacid dehydrogenase, partial [Campylobacter sp.]|nr:D-2-hydroxyacid dehydrogenase [Campylobacter sp.]